ncbi:MAG: M28 family peptidase [Pseudomonadota bacterium]|nr:M28 family peptidase [Syntrophaceae bacterium]MBP7033499.1 M28 family peptidase [Syntrophobacterales bacterium]MDI9555898.1 M28 family peptidase [Pseudomonadota bacterium]NLX31094.1 M28 family peptidase [Deltaproteobacteria bacterium]HNU85212.1 M28 family peptidase [Syntrophales bacterium]
MRKKMIYTLLILLFGLAAVLLYPVAKIRLSAPVIHPETRFLPASNEEALRSHVHALSVVIGSRSIREPDNLREAERYIRLFLESQGIPFELQGYDYEKMHLNNIVVTRKGTCFPDESLIVGAHYDSVQGTPGADDNASAVAVLLEMCRELRDYRPDRTLKMVFFVLEEPPAFMTPAMGSYFFASQAKERGENITGMIALEMLGYFSDADGSQTFPLPGMHWLYPDRGNFIGVIGNVHSRELTLSVAEALKAGSEIPVEHLVALPFISGVGLSDHGPFWKFGYRAVMVTDTAFYRNPNYHTARDTIGTLRFDRMSQIVRGMVSVVEFLTRERG